MANNSTSLDDLSERLDRIEQTLSRLDNVMHQASSALAGVTDAADDYAAKSTAAGVLIDDRVREAFKLLDRLTEPNTLQVLNRLLGRLGLLDSAIDAAAQVPDAAATVADMADDWALQAAARGIDIDGRVKNALGLLQRLTEPEVASAVEAVLQRADRVEGLVAQLDALPAFVATVMDVLDELIANAAARDLDIEQILRSGFAFVERVARLLQSPEFAAMLPSLMGPQSLELTAQIARAVSRAHNEPPGRAGLLALWRASRDPEIQRTLDFGVRLLRHLGQQLAYAPNSVDTNARKELSHG